MGSTPLPARVRPAELVFTVTAPQVQGRTLGFLLGIVELKIIQTPGL